MSTISEPGTTWLIVSMTRRVCRPVDPGDCVGRSVIGTRPLEGSVQADAAWPTATNQCSSYASCHTRSASRKHFPRLPLSSRCGVQAISQLTTEEMAERQSRAAHAGRWRMAEAEQQGHLLAVVQVPELVEASGTGRRGRRRWRSPPRARKSVFVDGVEEDRRDGLDRQTVELGREPEALRRRLRRGRTRPGSVRGTVTTAKAELDPTVARVRPPSAWPARQSARWLMTSGRRRRLEGGQLGRRELERADVEPILEGVPSRPAQLPDHLAVQRGDQEAEPVGLGQQPGQALDRGRGRWGRAAAPLPARPPGRAAWTISSSMGRRVAHLTVGRTLFARRARAGDLVVGRLTRPAMWPRDATVIPRGTGGIDRGSCSDAAATRALKRAAPMAT